MKNSDAKEFKTLIDSDPQAVIIDVRTPEEEGEGLIPNSINLNIMEPAFAAHVMDLDKSKNYYVYCRSGGRSASACQFMESQGLNTVNLAGGIMAWNQL